MSREITIIITIFTLLVSFLSTYDMCGFHAPFKSNIEEDIGFDYNYNRQVLCTNGTLFTLSSDCVKYSKLNSSYCLETKVVVHEKVLQ